VLAATGLTACRAEPTVAAYVGDTRYTQKQVDEIVDGAKSSPDGLKVDRQKVVDLLVSIDLGKRVVADKGYRADASANVDAATVAGAFRLDPTSEFVKLWVEWDGLRVALSQAAAKSAPDDADLARIVRSFVVAGVTPGSIGVDDIQGEAFVSSAVAVRQEMAQAADRYHVTVNPRYKPLGVPLLLNTGSGYLQYDLPYVAGSDAVHDRS